MPIKKTVLPHSGRTVQVVRLGGLGTPMNFRSLPPQSSASTNSAISPTYFKHFIDHCIPLCPEQDSNLHASRHTHLKRARLPIPPPGHR